MESSLKKNLEILKEHRDAILVAEIGMWFHMIGKYSTEFYENCSENRYKDFKELKSFFTEAWMENIWSKFPEKFSKNTENINFQKIIENHSWQRGPEINDGTLSWKIKDAHGFGSGSDKGAVREPKKNEPPENRFYLQQEEKKYISTAFGYEREPIWTKKTKEHWNNTIYFAEIQCICLCIKDYIEKNEDYRDEKNEMFFWTFMRNQLIGIIKKYFQNALAETRRPNNDITLWDQTLSSVAAFKAELAEQLIKGRDYDVKEKPKLRTLRIALDGTGYLSQSIKMQEILWKKEAIQKGFDRIRDCIEIEYPFGMEIYRSHDMILFLVSDVENLDTYITDKEKGIPFNKVLEKTFYGDYFEENEIQLDITLSKKSSRKAYFVGGEIDKPIPDFTYSPEYLHKKWKNSNSAQKCSVCDSRPVETKARKYCSTCRKRLEGRAKNWYLERVNDKGTIWMDEVQDKQKQVALIVGKFHLKNWNNGKMLSTMVNVYNSGFKKDFYCVLENMKELSKDNSKWKDIKELDPLGKIFDRNKLGKSINEFKIIYMKDQYSDSEINNVNSALALWQKPASFSRIQRIWRTTNTFWEEVQGGILNILEKRARYKIYIEKCSGKKCFQTYRMKLGKHQITICKTDKTNEFITADYFEDVNLLESVGKYIDLIEFDSEKIETSLRIEKVTIDENRDYLPNLNILSEPEIFMAFVPAEKALEISDSIKSKYEKEMAKVRNRLPLNLGMVVGNAHTPVKAFMETGFEIIRHLPEEENFTIDNNIKINNGYNLELFPKSGNEFCWKVNTEYEEGTDLFYPFYKVRNGNIKRKSLFKSLDGDYVHISELEPNDKVSVQPSKFTCVYLGSASKRYGIKRRLEKAEKKPWSDEETYRGYLESIDELQDIYHVLMKFDKKQLRNMMDLISRKKEMWKDEDVSVMQSFFADVVDKTMRKDCYTEKNRQTIKKAARNGRLNIAYHLLYKKHIEVIKSEEE